MPTDPLSFLTSSPEQKSSQTDPLSFLNKPQRSKTEKAARIGGQYAIGAAETALFPYELAATTLKSKGAQTEAYRKNLFEDIERLSEQKQTGVWNKEDEQLLQSLVDQVKDPKKSEKFVQTADIGVGDLAEKSAKQFGYDLEPEGMGEHAARLTGNVLSPSGIAKGISKLPSIGRSLVNKEFRHALKGQKNWARLATAAKGNPERETMLKFSQDHNLSPQATSLLFQTEGKADWIAKFGKKTKKFKETVSELQNKLGKNYEELKALGKEGGHLNLQETEKLSGNLGKLLEEMTATHVIGPEAGPVINTIEKSVESINNKPSTIKELINSRINLSDSINWNNIERGDFYRKEARKIFADAITEKNPSIGRRLTDTDKAWAKYEQFKDVLDKKIPFYKIKGVPVPAPLITAAVFLGAPFYAGGLVGAAKGYAIKEAVQRFTTQLAINPKFQKPLKVWQKQMMNGSTKGQRQAFLVIKHMAKKEDPEMYEAIKDIEVD
jgi:hypothetical protein